MEHVFVETNWVVDYAAPILARGSAARELHEKAQRGELSLHVPAIALVEARKVIREKSPRDDLNAIREYVRTARDAKDIAADDATATFEVLSRFEQHVAKEKAAAPRRIEALAQDLAVDVFALDAAMLERSVQLAATSSLEIQSFDMAILAAVLVAGERLRATSALVSFCTLDADLRCWDRKGASRPELQALYDAAGVWVYGDFLLTTPPRPERAPPR